MNSNDAQANPIIDLDEVVQEKYDEDGRLNMRRPNSRSQPNTFPGPSNPTRHQDSGSILQTRHLDEILEGRNDFREMQSPNASDIRGPSNEYGGLEGMSEVEELRRIAGEGGPSTLDAVDQHQMFSFAQGHPTDDNLTEEDEVSRID